ncbi:kinase-like domain-containing protein [Syncephalis fuscata]|nr:kinase-like domain-containing protein [Syncephalis fuscata]
MKPRRGMALALGSMPELSATTTPFANFSKFVDPSGKLNFDGKAVLHAQGVDFSSGKSYKINMGELQLLDDLGAGQYGVVKKVLHRPTNVIMAMKETRLELDQNRLNQILMELDVLNKSHSPLIVEFYGAFFIESCVYYCMEYMDAGSLDRLYTIGVEEDVLAKITESMVKGLKLLKDELSIIHRDVKPTNVLVNTKGEVKLCDFGVSGQLVQSLAKTHIGCHSYMAPERIASPEAVTYTASSDVWSLGVSLLEVALAEYPFPVDTVYMQLQSIVKGEARELPEQYSDEARDFIQQCLKREANERPTYGEYW